MKNLKIILPAILFTILFSCEEGNHSRNDFAAEESVSAIDLENNSETPLSSTAATHQDAQRKFVRTADLSMEVENVYRSTTTIEKKLTQIGGFVTESNLHSRIISKEIFPIDADSAKEIKKFTVNNSMTVRVPQLELADFLISLGDEIEFLNFRNISAQDVSLNLEMSDLERQRLHQTSNKLDKINEKNGKISDKQNVVNNADEKQAEIIQNIISSKKLNDDVAYSSVTLLLTEKEKIAETMVINPKSYDQKYRTGFGYRAGNSIQNGFYFFQTIFIGLLYLWPLWIFVGLLIFGIKWYTKKMRTL